MDTALELERAMVPLNCIEEWADNPRRVRSSIAVENSAANMRSQGQLMPLILVPSNTAGVYLAIDGETRRRGHLHNVQLGHTAHDAPIDARILPPNLTLSQLLAVALAANTIREEMNVIDKMRAFRDLAKAGMKPRAIGDLFNMGSRIVQQHIALGDLVDGAQQLVAAGQRPLAWAQAMTLGTARQQEQIVSDINANAALYPDAASVRYELTRGNIPISAARFDPQVMGDCIIRDLFTPDDEGYFSDNARFWEHQLKAVEAIVDQHRQTHAAVRLYDRERFNEAGWSTNGDPTTSTAVVIVNHDGTVEERLGLIPPAYLENEPAGIEVDDGTFLDAAADIYEAEFGADGSAIANNGGSNDNTPPTAQKKSLLLNATKATNEYLGAQVIAELKLRVASDSRLAMAFVIAQTLTRSGGLASSMQHSTVAIAKDAQTSDPFLALDNRRTARDRIAAEAGILGVTSPANIVSRLMALGNEALFDLFAWTVAESVATPLNEATAEIYDAIGSEIMSSWRIEDAYLDTLTNAQIRALATEIIDVSNAPSRSANINVVRKAILASVEQTDLDDSWMQRSTSWLPPQITALREAVEARVETGEADSIADVSPSPDELSLLSAAA